MTGVHENHIYNLTPKYFDIAHSLHVLYLLIFPYSFLHIGNNIRNNIYDNRNNCYNSDCYQKRSCLFIHFLPTLNIAIYSTMPEGHDEFARFVLLPVFCRIPDTALQITFDNPAPAHIARTFQASLSDFQFYLKSSVKLSVPFQGKIGKDNLQYRANPVQQAAGT